VETPTNTLNTLTLGISPCPNDVYIFAGLLLGQVAAPAPFSVRYEDVETLNGLSRRGELDLVKISYANYLHIEDDYELLDCGGALGRGVGPLLLTHGQDALDPEREVLVPGEFTTANFLLNFYRRGEAAPLRKRYLPFDALYNELCNQQGAQGVVIHEKRFTYQQDNLTLIQDLGEHWERETGYAIPLGAIAARRSLSLREDWEAAVRESLAWSDAHPQEALALCREHAQDLTESVMRSHIELYVNEYSRDLGKEGRDAVAFFLAEQRRLTKLK
jgi:1,4-dihydroxy-6-naphthoate synthase